jgi:hypothetical protein
MTTLLKNHKYEILQREQRNRLEAVGMRTVRPIGRFTFNRIHSSDISQRAFVVNIIDTIKNVMNWLYTQVFRIDSYRSPLKIQHYKLLYTYTSKKHWTIQERL